MHFQIPPFVPHPMLRNGHLQTILAVYLPGARGEYRARQHEVCVSEGDRVVIHDDRPASWDAGQAICLLVHGLSGSHRSPYMVRVAAKLNQRGVRTFRLDLRGAGAGFGLAKRPYHAGQSGDLRQVIEFLNRICPGAPLFLAGFSLGGNIVLKLLGEWTEAPRRITAAVAVSPPIDLRSCSKNIGRGNNVFYDQAFVKALQRLRRTRRQFGLPDIASSTIPRNLYEFDEQFTAPLSGFRNAEEYYRQASALPRAAAIRLPTLVLTAEDDPLIPVNMFRDAHWSPRVQLHITRYGGHLGFLARRGSDPDGRWMDGRIVDWIAEWWSQSISHKRLTDGDGQPLRPSLDPTHPGTQ